LLTAAGEIISALVAGGPAEDLDDYDQGAGAVGAFMDHMVSSAETLDDFHAIAAVESFLTRDDGWQERAERGWTEARRQHLQVQCTEVLNREQWTERVADGLQAEDDVTFWKANQAAQKLGIDTFDLLFRKVTEDPYDGPWFQAWQQADQSRGRRIVELVRRALPLGEIGTGLGDDLGLGPEWRAHQSLDWTLQALRDYPGLGGDLLRSGSRRGACQEGGGAAQGPLPELVGKGKPYPWARMLSRPLPSPPTFATIRLCGEGNLIAALKG
jgi:hypothetical protein